MCIRAGNSQTCSNIRTCARKSRDPAGRGKTEHSGVRHTPAYREARRYSWYMLQMPPLPQPVAAEVRAAIKLLHAQRALLVQTASTLAEHLEVLEKWCDDNDVPIPEDTDVVT